jgi:diguanylate cyclase (GGDEF)-like protein
MKGRRSFLARWAIWEEPRWLACYVLLVTAGYGVALGFAASATVFVVRDLPVFAALLAFGAVSIELTRRAGEPAGFHKDAHGVWLIPVAIVLPPFYVLAALIPAMVLTQWRIRRNLIHRRMFTAAAQGLSYGAASVAFHALAARVTGMTHPASGRLWAAWALAVIATGILRSLINKTLVIVAAKGSDPSISAVELLFTRDPLYNDFAELFVGMLVTLAALDAWYFVALALPIAAMFQRSFRHAELMRASRIDAKTGLLNAATWQREARLEFSRASRTGTSLALAVIDIDHFKQVNDTYGHLTGDAVLSGLAAALRALLRDYDITGRFGGDELAVLLPGTTAGEARRIAARLCDKLASIVVPVDNAARPELTVTVSVGVAGLEPSCADLDELIAAADAAMYRAKASGRNCVR